MNSPESKTGALTVKNQSAIQPLKSILEDPELKRSPFLRRRLIKTHFEHQHQQYLQQFKAALEVDSHRLTALKETRIKQIEADRVRIELQIRAEFLTVLAELGMKVEQEQLNFLTKFGARLQGFRKQLRDADLHPRDRRLIQGAVDSCFDRVFERLDKMTGRIVGDSEQV